VKLLDTLYRIRTAAPLWLNLSSIDLKQQDSVKGLMERGFSKKYEEMPTEETGETTQYSLQDSHSRSTLAECIIGPH
jgi:hypothetical protein